MTTATTLSPEQFETIAAIAEERWGLHLPETKRTLVQGRVTKLMRRVGLATVEEVIERISHETAEEALLELFDFLATNTTSFFRESQHFDYLERVLYRALPERRLRIWSGACSIGAEPYTLAVHALEHLPQPDSWDIRFLATDLSSKAVDRTKAGVYNEKEMEGMPKQLRFKHFSKDKDNTWRVKPHLREMISVHRLNLLDPWPMQGPFDAIFLRNVMIYFDAPVREKIVNRMAPLLADHGVLVIGSAETLSGLSTPYTTVQPAIYRAERGRG